MKIFDFDSIYVFLVGIKVYFCWKKEEGAKLKRNEEKNGIFVEVQSNPTQKG